MDVSQKIISSALLSLMLSACVSSVKLTSDPREKGYVTDVEVQKLLDSKHVVKGVSVGGFGIFPVYNVVSIIPGFPMLKNDPTTVIASATNDDVTLTLLTNLTSNIKLRTNGPVQIFAIRFTEALAQQRKTTWGGNSRRKYNFRLYYIADKLGVSRNKRRFLLGETFRLSFYNSRRFGLQAGGTSEILAHESYHLEVSRLGSRPNPKKKKTMPPALQLAIEETAGAIFGNCVSLRSEGMITRIGNFVPEIKMSGEKTRRGTLTDAQMRAILDPGQTINKAEAYKYGPAMFLNLWTEYAGLAEEIHVGEPAAEKLFDLCANHIAHPDDIWPILWALANDGKEAPEIPSKGQEPQTGAVAG